MKFSKICKMSQKELKKYLTGYLKTKYNNVIEMDGFVYAEGDFPVMLIAHMDTVHKQLVKEIVYENGGKRISSPQGIGGDDRCGIYMISKIIEQYKCSVLFTEDEEIGCVGAGKFVRALDEGLLPLPNVNYLIELDRKGSRDAVFYECDNEDFEDFILDGNDWKYDYGSYTDIVEIAPAIGVAAVNFSCGYYNAHTEKEYVMFDEMLDCIERVKNVLARTTEKDYFKWVEKKYGYTNKYKGGKFEPYSWYDVDDEKEMEMLDSYYLTYYIVARTHNGGWIENEVYAASEEEAIGRFLIDNPSLCVNDIVDFICEDY